MLDELEKVFPLVHKLEATPQDPEWHAEGNVRIHTERVIAEMRLLLEKEALSDALDEEESQALVLGAALHDIGKPLTTREEEIDGKVRIISPRHAARGRSYVALRIAALDVSEPMRERILALVGYHHEPQKLILREAPDFAYRKLARAVDPALLYWLECADLRGRECDSVGEAEEWLELFKMRCEELDLWRCQDPYADWREEIDSALADEAPEVRDYVFAEAVRQYENGEIAVPSEALARTHAYRKDAPTLTLMCGPSGSGKSEWIERQLGNSTHVSLDAIREELCGRRDDQSKNGQVMQLAKERLRQALRERRDIVWDATNLREDGRAMLLDLAHRYHARSRIVTLSVPVTTLRNRNRSRKHAISTKVLENQLDRFQWPHRWEAHEVMWYRS